MIDIKKKLQDEITALEYEMHVELPKEILKARAHGDLSENAEYHAAKERQGMVNARLGPIAAAPGRDGDDRFHQDPAGQGRAGLHGGGAGYEARRGDHLSIW